MARQHQFGVAFVIEVDLDDDDTVESIMELIDTVVIQEMATGTRFRLTQVAIHPDPTVLFPTSSDIDTTDDGPCDCADHGAGYLIGQTYGHTDPPDGAVIVQRCDQCEVFDGDIAAAVAYANVHGGRVHVIGDGKIIYRQTDVWVMPDEPWNLNFVDWHLPARAIGYGWVAPEEGA
jgi:hypothetical protein